jgi:hypothetical protein
MYSEDDLLPLSGLQHLLFCERQCALRDHSSRLDAPKLKEVSMKIQYALESLQKDDFIFRNRNHRPPLDNVNCLLSFLYTLLMHDVWSEIVETGFKPVSTSPPMRGRGLKLYQSAEDQPYKKNREFFITS